MAFSLLKFTVLLVVWNMQSISATAEVIARLMTDNISNSNTAIYNGTEWLERGQSNVKQGVASIEKSSYVAASLGSDPCLKSLDEDGCNEPTIGVQFWVRYKGFISDILGDNVDYHNKVSTYLETATPSNVRWINCFNSRYDGWKMAGFHNKCDNKGPTVSLFKVRNDAIFGGFTSADWGGSSTYADKGFLFSLKNADNKNIPLLNLKTKAKAIVSGPTKGPSFGDGDLTINDDPNVDGNSNCSSLGTSYSLPADYETETKNLLAGSEKFGLTNMEVFYMECSQGLGMNRKLIQDDNITNSAGVSAGFPQNARLNSGSTTEPGTFLSVKLNGLSLVTGFAVRAAAQSCTSFQVKYTDVGNQERNVNQSFEVVSSQVTRFVLKLTISATEIKFVVPSGCGLAVEIYGCDQGTCDIALGMKSGAIADAHITASHHKDDKHTPQCSRANQDVDSRGKGCWKADSGSHLTIDLIHTTTITGIGIQNCFEDHNHPKYVKIQYSLDDKIFHYYRGIGTQIMVFNTESLKIDNNVKKFKLIPAIVAKKIRFFPDNPEMRVELYGCPSHKGPEELSTTLVSTSNFSMGQIGFGVSVTNTSVLQGVALSSSKKAIITHSDVLSMATWTRVTYWSKSGSALKLFSNATKANTSTDSPSVVYKASRSSIVVIDHSSITSSNPQNIQLSDVLVWKTSSNDDKIKADADKIIDGPVEFDANTNANGSAYVPYIIKKGWTARETCTPSQNKGTGPCSGSSNGGYLYLEASDVAKGTTAVLESFYRVSAYKCFRFSYHMWGQNVGRLNVYVKDHSGVNELIWRLGGDQGNQWHTATVPLSRSRTFKLIMEGVVGDGFQGDIAVDAFHFTTQSCASAPAVASVKYTTGFARSKIIGGVKESENFLMRSLNRANAPNTFWVPCFIQSRDDNIAKFWENCKGKGPTVTLGRSNQNYIFGAYSDRDWMGSPVKGSSTYEIASSKAFIFSLTNPTAVAEVFPINPSKRHNAITINTTDGPRFGQGLQVNPDKAVYSKLDTEYGNSSTTTYLTGSQSFNSEELEVFYAGDHPCDKWCALRDWTCNEANTKCECDYTDRLLGWCLMGKPQAFLGLFYDYSLSPDLYWNFDNLANGIQNMKTHKSVSVSLSSSVAQIANGISRNAIKLDGTSNVDLGSYSGTCLFDDKSAGLSVSLWLKYSTKAGADKQTLFTIGNADNGGSRIQITQPNSTLEELSVLINIQNRTLYYRFGCPKNIWSHIVISWSSLNGGSLTVYRNAKPVDLQYDICFGCNATDVSNKNVYVYLGEKNVDFSPKAWIDEIGVWCKGLANKEVQDIYQFFQGPPGLVVILSLTYPSKTWTTSYDFESSDFHSVNTSIITEINTVFPSVSSSNISFYCGGPSVLSCNVTFRVDANDGNAIDELLIGSLEDKLTSSIQFGVPNNIAVLRGFNTSAYDINVTLEMPDEDVILNGIFQKYTLFYHPEDDISLLQNKSEERYETSWKLENLTSYLPYNITLRLDYLGGTFLILSQTVWTGERVPDGPPLNFEAMPLNSSCIKLQWQDPKPHVPGRIRGFNITYVKSNEPDADTKIVIVYYSNQTIYHHELCGLLTETLYDLKIAAFTVGLGPFTPNRTAWTTGAVPLTPPGNVVSMNATEPNDPTSTCLVSWEAPLASTTNGNLTSYRVVYTDLKGNKTIFCEVGTCNTSKLLKDLKLYGLYKVVVSASNFKGHGPYSEPVFCYTEGTVPGAPPQNVQALGSGPTSCHVKWEGVPKEFHNGLILGYNVTYLKENDPDTDLKFKIVDGLSSNSTDLKELGKFAKYNISIAAFTEKGLGNESGLPSTMCQTEESAPDGVPLYVTELEKTNTSCTFSWAPIPPELANGIIRGYEATIHNVNTTDPEGIFIGFQMTCAEGSNSTFKNLRPFHMYNITLAGFNSKAVSNKSLPLQCLTDEEAPLVSPPNIRCKTKTSSIIEVCWDEVPLSLRQGIVREYHVSYEATNRTWWYTKDFISNKSITPPVLCWNLTELEEYTPYAMKVKAVTIKEGNFSETPVECKTGEGVPRDPPQDVAGRNTSAYSLLVSWKDPVREQPGIVRSFVVFWRIWNASEETTVNETVPATKKTFHITGLKLHTMYCLQVAAVTDGAGTKSHCTYTFTDDKWLPPPDGIPANLTEINNSTETNCSLQWSKTNNSNPDPDGRVLGYHVFYRIAGTNDTEEVVVVTGINSTQQVLQSLEEYTKYEIRVAAYNLYGVGNKSSVMLCHTKEDAPSEPPPNITAVNSSSTSIIVGWVDIPRFDQNGVIRKYCILIFEKALGNSSATKLCFTPDSTPASRRRRREITIDKHTKAISGLKKFTEYGIQMFGHTIKDGPLSPVVYVTTAEDAPSATVANLTIANSSSSSILLEWDQVPFPNQHGIIRSFRIYYSKTDWPLIDEYNITLDLAKVRTTQSSPQYRFNLTGLEIWTNYSMQVSAQTILDGPRSNETVVSTDEDIPCLPPHYITFDIPAYSSLLVRWTEVLRHCRNGIILGYRLIYRELSNKPPVLVNFTASERYYIIENMNMDVNYTVEILAFTRIGDGNTSFDLAQPDKMGPRSKPINVTTYNFTTPTTLKVEWKPIQDDIIIEKLMGYRVSWKVLSEGDEEVEDAPWFHYTVRKDTLDTVITGLKNYVHYQIEISGFTRGGSGPSGVVWGDTCRCFKRITTNYRIFSPYNSVSISEDLKSINMSGMIPEILNNLTVECCETCQSHGLSYVDFVQNGQNRSAFQQNEMKVKALIDDTNDLSFPVYGWKWQDRYQAIYRYIPLVESPGFAFLLLEPKTESPLIAIVNSIIATWPYLLITLLMALLAGIIVWFLDTAYNPEQFPHSFIKGAGNGWWWAFISMTTLGYGDKVPAANHAKAFAVIWVLMGLVVYGILSGTITTAFTTIIYQSSTQLYGAKVATVHDTPEYRFGIRRNAKVNTENNYTKFDEVLQALIDQKVTGMLMDAYEAGTKREQFLSSGGKIRIHKVYDFASTFGVVLAGPSTRLYKCSRNWMSGHRAEMSSHIAKFIQVVEEQEVNELVEITTGLFDPDSSVFKGFLKFSLIAFVVLLIPGVIWEVYYQVGKRKRNKLTVNSPAFNYKENLVQELGEFTRNFLKDLESKLTDMRERHKAELSDALRRRAKNGDNNSFQEKGLLPLQKLKDKKFAPIR